jgi:hypothetical protein
MLQEVDQEEGVNEVAVPEDQVLVELDAPLAVEVEVEQLARPQCLGDTRGVIEARHLLVAHLGVHAHNIAVL